MFLLLQDQASPVKSPDTGLCSQIGKGRGVDGTWSLPASQGSTEGEDGFTDKNQSRQGLCMYSVCRWEPVLTCSSMAGAPRCPRPAGAAMSRGSAGVGALFAQCHEVFSLHTHTDPLCPSYPASSKTIQPFNNHPRLFKPSVIDRSLSECSLIDIGF